MFTPRILITLVCAVALFAAAPLAAACDDDDDDGGDATSTPTAEVEASPTPEQATAQPTPSSEIRSMDLATAEPVQSLEQTTGGVFDESGVLYGDLTQDNVEEAVAPISSEGSAGTIAIVVLTPDGDEAVREIFQKQAALGGGLVADIVDGQLVLTEPVPGPDDPECCPSELRTTIYAWDGSTFAVESETVAPNVQGGTTPTSQ